MSDHAWDDHNAAAVEQARELDWQEREHAAHVERERRDRFEDRVGEARRTADARRRANDPTCEVCGETYVNFGAHQERCRGRAAA